ncbi:MAG: DnaT-like ssDNA-binding domain-containing protein [Pseudomonadales bacterium]|nr:DnaT-like ssDNA-binding domain-containing protein [Pseudomonadales bacterium]
MTTSLIPERPLLISPTLAATIGLEQAVMLHVISELLLQHPAIYRNCRQWGELSQKTLLEAMPFWELSELKRIRKNLQEQGLLLVEPALDRLDIALYAINQAAAAKPQAAAKVSSAPAATIPAPASSVFRQTADSGTASHIPPDWQPNEDIYQQCTHHGIPRDFVEQRVKSFVIYWRERQKAQYSWHHTFLKYILREWRNEQSYQGAKELETDMSANWRPSQDAVTILEHAGISSSFIKDSIPEFILYWRERGLVTSTWSTKFIAHVRRQWAKFTLAVEHDSTPRLIPPDYQPSDACYEVLGLANIDIDFAREQIREFVLYWQDSKQVSTSWNTKFLQHVKYRWASQHLDSAPMKQQMESAVERLTDRSWAD